MVAEAVARALPRLRVRCAKVVLEKV
jgi:hypothetical protein